VIASTEGSTTRIEELRACGARDFLRKPFRPERLRDVLQPLLGKRSEDAAASVDGAF
jgi:FixJ family two-component response regulator